VDGAGGQPAAAALLVEEDLVEEEVLDEEPLPDVELLVEAAAGADEDSFPLDDVPADSLADDFARLSVR
jgi:hypothetical protein